MTFYYETDEADIYVTVNSADPLEWDAQGTVFVGGGSFPFHSIHEMPADVVGYIDERIVSDILNYEE